MEIRSSVFLRDDLASILDGIEAANPEFASALRCVRIALHIEPVNDIEDQVNEIEIIARESR